ncbi:MAG: MFS transporter [Planctomycetia bacterium]|nr:MFS transporter [Planctomycetia bacterium]
MPSAAAPTSHPAGFWFFFWGEFAERCSYYGMRAILSLYLVNVIHLTDARATAMSNAFKMACFLLPLAGGFLADRFFGKYWTIVGFSVPYVLGHFVLGIPHFSAVVAALLLLAMGSGVIKPNISTLMGMTYDQQRPGQEQLRGSAFRWFYLAINIGSAISIIALPLIRNHSGYAVAFQFPAWLMVIALGVFAAGKPFYAKEVRELTPPTPEVRRQRWETLLGLLVLFSPLILFWLAYEQNDNLWVFFSRDYVNLKVPGLDYTLEADQLQFINPISVLLLVPVLNLLFNQLDPQAKTFTATRKITAGLVLGAAASGIMALAAVFVGSAGTKLSIAWPVAGYFVLTIGEVLVYGTGLELAYAAAPKNMKGFVTGCFLLTMAVANLLNIPFSQLYGGSQTAAAGTQGPMGAGTFFALTAALPAVAAVVFYFVGRRFERGEAQS